MNTEIKKELDKIKPVQKIKEAVESSEELSVQIEYIGKCQEYIMDLKNRLGRPLYACINTFGCQMNARDSEKLLGILKEIGFVETDDETKADFVLYNTCTVRENANLRVYGRLGQLRGLKRKKPHMLIALCGCMMQEPEVVEKIKKSYRFVDIVFGTFNIYELAQLIYERITTNKQVVDIRQDTNEIVENLPVERKFPFKSGVNIMYGCDKFCTYCIVPYVRGREKSREPKEIIREIEHLVADGVKEVMLLGQNVNSYGKGLDDDVTFANLLAEIDKIEGLERIRFMTPYPSDFGDDVIEVCSKSTKICNHFHMPVQSGSTRLLKKMNRRYTKEEYLSLIDRIRAKLPNVSFTTDIIVGFPGETEEDFLETLDVVRKANYDSAYTFIYSKRTGTPAAKFEEQVPEDVVKDRFNRLLEVVDEVCHKNSKRFEGQTARVLVEGLDDHEEGMVTGRMTNNILVHFKGDASLIGSLVDVKLVECKGFYYMGELV
ncbi:MAG: tRNA (N6-isopentenyl adenosine(37)-C2)-methylthiotransferase MiaB [Lachnospira sp.]|nr:tRNA (N6-isopentenyl adenosine(37)-C2)-methylthiotransferase MiaB [Lachnospira sp.]